MYIHRGLWKSSYFPRIAGVQWSNTVGSTLWGMASGVAVVLDIVLGLADIAPASRQPLQVVWSSPSGVLSSKRGVMAFRGPCRSGSCVRWRRQGTRRPRTPRAEYVRAHWEVRETCGGPGPLEGGSGAPAASDGHPSSRGPWRHRTPSHAGGGPGAIRMMR